MINVDDKKQPIFAKQTHKMFLLFMVFATLLASASVLSDIIFFPDKTVEVTLKNAVKKNKERESVIKGFIDDSKLFLQTLGNSDIFKKYLADKANKEELERALLMLSQSQKDFMQLRYINKEGIEEVRVDRGTDDKSFIVPKNQLQDKSDRYYFTNSKDKTLGKVWFSAIDLNIEHGKIEIPHRPTFRAILPISIDGKFGGIFIINYEIERFLKKLLYMPLYDIILTDGKGYPLIHYNKDKNWGFYSKDKFNISQQFPKASKDILENEVFTANKMTSRRFNVPVAGDLILILKLKDAYIEKIKSEEIYHYLMLFIITFALSILFSFIVVKKFSELLNSLKDKNDELKNELYFDSLTSLKNRRSLLSDISINHASCLILIDIQSFSEVNDLYGGKAGDVLLQKFTSFLKTHTKECEPSIYRLYGNTFALLSSIKKEEHEYMALIKKLLDNLANYNFSFTYEEAVLDFVVEARIGFTMESKSCNLLESADMALNYAKKTNKDFVVYDKSLGIEKLYEKDIGIIKTIKKALSEDRIIPYFQPIHKKDKIFYESLIRMVLEDGTVLTPFHFLESAKKTRLYFSLTKQMIEKTFQVFEGTSHNFSINLSYLDIKNTETIHFIRDMLKRYNISNQLIIEIVESDTFRNYDLVINFLHALKDMGVKIAVDDFGSGYSNFSHLIKLNPDYIKIDGSLIKDIDTNEKSFSVVKAIVNFARDMEMTVIAEFIHSQEVYEKAKTLNMDGYQGFLLGRPQSAEEIFGKIGHKT